MKKGNRYYTRTLKDGTIKRRVHGADGKILRWEIAEDLDTPSGEYKMIEYSMYFIPTRATAKSTPSSIRNWEVRIRLPYSDDIDEDDIEMYGRNMLADITNENMVDTSEFSFGKMGSDYVEYSKEDGIKWKIIDTTRPQYKYPKEKDWGDYNE